MKAFYKKLLTCFLAVVLTVSALPAAAFAQEENTPKEEVVYVNLNADGSVSDIYVVNSFDLPQGGRIIDYGNYTALRNMTSTAPIAEEDGAIQIDAGEDKLYYEGRLDNRDIPWDISLQYYLDGVECPATELAGKSGGLAILLSFRKNPDCRGSFFEDYALQASLTLDTNRAENITAKGATVANVGSEKQLTYTILPGQESEFTITADVTDFEMGGISINGIRLNMEIEVDDQVLMDQVLALRDGIERLDDGAGDLKEGIAALEEGAEGSLQTGADEFRDGVGQLHTGTAGLKDGGSDLQAGAMDLQKGADTLDDGAQDLNDGILLLEQGLKELNGKSSELTAGSAQIKTALLQIQNALNGVSDTSAEIQALVEASAQIKSGIQTLSDGVSELQKNVSYEAYKAVMLHNGLDLDALEEGNGTAIQKLRSLLQLLELLMNTPAAEAYLDQLQELKGQLEQTITLLEGNNANIQGTKEYLTALNTNIQALSNGAAELKENYEEFDEGIGRLAATLGNLLYQISGLSQGIDTLVEEYAKLDDGLKEYTGGVAQIVAGYTQITKGSRILVEGSGALRDGSASLYSGTSELLDGIIGFYDATGTLQDGTGQLEEGVAKLLTGVASLYDGSGELKDGTAALRQETSGMDTEISEQIDALLESISGGGDKTASFVSDQNTRVQSVQFVMKTDGIEIPEAAVPDAGEEKPLTFWQKLLKLFGLYHEG